MSLHKNRLVQLLLAIFVSGLFCYLVLRKYPLGELGKSFSQIDYQWFWAALCFRVVLTTLQGLRWKTLYPLYPFGISVEGSLVSETANLLIPARGGEAVRAWYLKRLGAFNFVENLAAALVERLLDAATILLIALASLAFLGHDPQSGKLHWPILLAIMTVAVILMAGYAVLRTDCATGIITWAEGKKNRLVNYLADWARDALGQLRQIRPARLAGAMAISILIVLIAGGMLWCNLRAAGVDITCYQSVVVYPLVALSLSLPVSVGYVGVFHGSMLLGLMLLGFDSNDVIGPVMVAHVLMFLPVLVFTSLYSSLHLFLRFGAKN